MSKEVIHKASPEHEVAYQDLIALTRKHAEKLSAFEMLAVAANMVGKLTAMQDARTVSVDLALELISVNIAEGNRQMIEEFLAKQTAGSA